jgi:hypothetical membrane protein
MHPRRRSWRRQCGDGIAHYRDTVSACLAGLGLLSPGFLCLVIAAGLAAPRYSMVRDEVSDLGLRSVTADILDGGLIGFGALLCLFATGLWRSFRADVAGRRAAFLLVIVGVSVACLAAFPMDPSVRHPTVHGTIHGALFFVCVGLFVSAAWMFARAFRRDPLWRRIAAYTRASAIAVVAVWVVWVAFASQQVFDPNPPLGAVAGLIERILIVVITVWIGVVAARHTQLAVLARRISAVARPRRSSAGAARS